MPILRNLFLFIRTYDGTEIAQFCPTHGIANTRDVHMGKKKFTTTLDEALIKAIKKLAIDLGCSANDLLEEGIHAVLKKYRRKAAKNKLSP